jgi:hypothetical protein
LLVLVALVALTQLYVISSQNVSRLCLGRAFLHGHVTIEPCSGGTIDQVVHGGHHYSDKAPGWSMAATPIVALVRLSPSQKWTQEGDPHVWLVNLFCSGLPFLLMVFALGRVSEGLAPGWGGAALVTFGLGTMVAPLATTSFDHDMAAAALFGAFLLAWRGGAIGPGLLAGTAILVDYTSFAAAAVIGLYVLRSGLGRAVRYGLAAVPPLVLLGVYNRAAFGSPFHLSYRYISGSLGEEQAKGLFGIHLPSGKGLEEVLVGNRGLLWGSPILVLAAAGIVLMYRRHRLEAIVCGAITILYFVINAGYFLPYGGASPGPRFLTTALPFLALGLGYAFERWTRSTIVLAALSLLATFAIMISWAQSGKIPYRDSIWGEIARLPIERGASPLSQLVAKNIVVLAGPNRTIVALVLALLAAAALVIAVAAPAGRRLAYRRTVT